MLFKPGVYIKKHANAVSKNRAKFINLFLPDNKINLKQTFVLPLVNPKFNPTRVRLN